MPTPDEPGPDEGASGPERPRRTLDVLALALLAGALAVAVRRGLMPLLNYDTYFHLRLGEEFLAGWSLRDPGSVTRFATADWVPTQWLPEVGMAAAEDRFGLAGASWFAAAQACVLVVVLYAGARRQAQPVIAGALVLAALLVLLPWLSLRPQVVGYVFLALTAQAWFRARDTGSAPWLLVPLTWVWAMSHGTWPLGIALGLVLALALALDARAWGALEWKRLAVPALSAVAAALTPVGPELYLQLTRVQERAAFFTEWGPVHLSSSDTVVMLGLLALTGGLLVVRRHHVRWFEVVLFLAAAACTFASWRTLPAAVVIVLPLTAGLLQGLTGERPRCPRSEVVAVSAATALALLVAAALAPTQGGRTVEQSAWLDQRLAALPAHSAVLSRWSYGSYLVWRFPDLDPVMHGYGDTFTLDELERNQRIIQVRDGWRDDVADTGAEVAVLAPDEPLARALRSQGWVEEQPSGDLALLTAPPGWPDG